MPTYPWYAKVDGGEPIQQGDMIASCPILVPSPAVELAPSAKVSAEVSEYNVTVMSQSCDLAYGKAPLVAVCAVFPLDEFGKQREFFKSKEGKEALRRGNVPGYHLLNKCEIPGFLSDFLVVDFRSVYGVAFDFITRFAHKRPERIRLLPPYREHLAQAFARFFMRVGLPVDIPAFASRSEI